MKICSTCGQEKTVSGFYADLRRGGYRSICKPCTKVQVETARQRRLDHDLVQKREYIAGRRTSPDYVARERVLFAEYRQSHLPQFVAYAQKYRCQKLGAIIGDVAETTDWIEIIRKDPCSYCGRIDIPMTTDHVTALSQGGTHSWENLGPACPSCNSSKRDKPLLSWMMERM